MIQSFAYAMILGLVSSLHCVGMCGPLALALPTRHLSHMRRVLAALVYHSGRIMVYTAAGVLFGIFGRGIYLAGYQQLLSIVLGLAILVLAVVRRLPAGVLLQGAIMRLWNAPGRGKFFLLGMVNGLLPCGMVYLAIAGALTRVQVWESAGFMACFGVGTLPLLLVVQYTGHRVGLPARVWLRRAIPALTIVIGVLLVLRGLDLGIPFISPVVGAVRTHMVECK